MPSFAKSTKKVSDWWREYPTDKNPKFFRRAVTMATMAAEEGLQQEQELLMSDRTENRTGRNGRNGRSNRRNRGRDTKSEKKVETWCVRDGDLIEHFKVWPLAGVVLFPCIGALLIGFDTGGCAWMVCSALPFLFAFYAFKKRKVCHFHLILKKLCFR